MRDNGLTQDEQNDGTESDGTRTEDSSNQSRDGTGQGQNGEGQPSPQEEQSPFPSDEEVNPNFNSNQDLPKPNEKRQAPTRTSPEKPDANSPSYQAEHPDKLDPSTRRQQGERRRRFRIPERKEKENRCHARQGLEQGNRL